MSILRIVPRAPRRALIAGVVLCGVAVPAALATAGGSAKVASTTFKLFPNPAFVACAAAPGKTPTVTATVTRGSRSDTLVLTLANFKPHLGFDLFTVQRSNQNADGTPVAGFTNFGMAWYQSDIQTDSSGSASVTIRTILLDQIFGFDPDTSLAPTNTFHVGFWFDSVAEAQPCSTTTLLPTPFNGEHTAGPVAFITRPKSSGLGPLCTDPNLATVPHSCNP